MRGLLSRIHSGGARPDEAASIIEHLRVVLNTRKGEAVTVPRLGVVDFTDVVHAFPHAIATLQSSIRETLLEFEPRLKSVIVRHVPDANPLVLRFEITAQRAQRGARGGSSALRFQTELTSGGRFEVGGAGGGEP